MPLHLATLGHTLFAAIGLLAYVLVTRAGRQRRHPSAALGWVIGILALPYVALPLFLMIGGRKLPRPAGGGGAQAVEAPAAVPDWARRLSGSLGLPPVRTGQRVGVLPGGRDALEALLGLVASARATVDVCTYLFERGEAGTRIADALLAAARRGVRVRVLVDAAGRLGHPLPRAREMRDGGITIAFFMPLAGNPLRGRSNLRNHRKLLVADGDRAWTGGRNLADEYFTGRAGAPAWADLSVVVEGTLARDLQQVFDGDWQLATRETPRPRAPAHHEGGDACAQLLPSGPDHAEDVLLTFLLTAIHQAKTRVLAASPYFVPDDALLQALVIACRRGVAVSLLVPARSNHRLADWARGRALRELAQAGADIRLSPGMHHAKLVVVDDAAALCGSANLDGRSLYLNFELSTVFYGATEIAAFAGWFERMAAGARPFEPRAPGLWRDMGEGVVRSIGFQL